MYENFEDFSFEELLLHLALTLDWRDGYEQYGEGEVIANLGDYEIHFNDEYDSIRIEKGNDKTVVFRQPTKFSFILESITNSSVGGHKFCFWGKEHLQEHMLKEFDKLKEPPNGLCIKCYRLIFGKAYAIEDRISVCEDCWPEFKRYLSPKQLAEVIEVE